MYTSPLLFKILMLCKLHYSYSLSNATLTMEILIDYWRTIFIDGIIKVLNPKMYLNFVCTQALFPNAGSQLYMYKL